MKWIDTPPMWLIAALLPIWWLDRLMPSLEFGPWSGWTGSIFVLAGIAVFVLASIEFRLAKTTIIPREKPDALIDTGVFRLSRNPIYLAYALILAGLILRWDAVLALPLIAAFIWIIQTRFILGEEAVLADAFPAEFEAYLSRTRRWI